MPVDPSLAGLLMAIEAGTPMSELSPAEARTVFRALTVGGRPPESLAPVGSIAEDEVAGGAGPLRARVYRPEGDGPVPTVVLFHGGGWVVGDLDTHAAMARSICAGTGSVVVAVDYRLGPEARFPAAAEDAIAAVRDVQARIGEYGGSEVLALAGDSAGGNLCAVAAQHVPGIAAQLLVYPATDVLGDYVSRKENGTGYFLDDATMVWFVGNYVEADTDLSDPLLSPLRGDLTGQPPAVVVTAEFDPLRDEGIAYADGLAAAGVPVRQTTYPGLIHGFFDMGPWSPACQAAADDTVAQFAELLRQA
ncbi:alpha/beta hydrolase [Nocardioides sp. QY071]|uniref:alpha/beta hydrolase n=1 Tax=Nocardioides sp. QY071 TaxID=3044187 RepID=UPI00249B6024|nr:alpha/beta hydrolase [Nocardioides sp. QY071]WGX99568.1 alpha/beta hydrolase [Nocardioides sp. QY071]